MSELGGGRCDRERGGNDRDTSRNADAPVDLGEEPSMADDEGRRTR